MSRSLVFLAFVWLGLVLFNSLDSTKAERANKAEQVYKFSSRDEVMIRFFDEFHGSSPDNSFALPGEYRRAASNIYALLRGCDENCFVGHIAMGEDETRTLSELCNLVANRGIKSSPKLVLYTNKNQQPILEAALDNCVSYEFRYLE